MSCSFTATRPPAHAGLFAAFVVAATLPLGCGAALAADMAVKATKSSAPAYQWTGCYVGINGGGGEGETNNFTNVGPGTHLVPADAGEVTNDGTGGANWSSFVGGGQVGCNLQSQTIVVGIEGDFDYFHVKPNFYNNTNTLPVAGVPFTINQFLQTNYLATIRPRFGVAADRNFAYVTGGVAFTRASYTESYSDTGAPVGNGLATASKSLTGWTAGAGWEYAFTDNLTFRAEYLLAKFGTVSAASAITDAAGGSNPMAGSANLMMQVIRGGANLKF